MADYDVLQKMKLAVKTPYALTRVGLDYIESRLDGATVPDPMSPMVQGIEIGSSQACIHIEEALALDRKNYIVLARLMRDLYAHASDYDMIHRFSSPGRGKIKLIYPRAELINAMVEVGTTKMRKLVIPRNTEVIIDNTTRLISLYPIEIRQPIHKGVPMQKAPLSIVYNTDKKTPLLTLDDNLVTWSNLEDPQNREYVEIEMEMLQLRRETSNESIEGNNFIFNKAYQDYFHYARCFYGSDAGGWVEFAITFSEFVYDKRKPTVIVTVEENVINFRIPPVYINNGLVPEGTSIRFDVYTTKGDFMQDLEVLQAGSFKINTPMDKDDPSLEMYSSPIRELEHSTYSTDTVQGGVNGFTFNELYNLMINNVSLIDVPITPAQIESRLMKLGFDVIQGRDDLTDRIYLASKTLAPAANSRFSSVTPSGIIPLETTIGALVKYPGVYDNGNRVTISPTTLFALENGYMSPLVAEEYPDAIANTSETLVNTINASNLVFSPFHYVLDTNDDNFNLRPYYLEGPKQTSREFISENSTTQLEISTVGFDISRIPEGYRLTVTALVGANFQALDITKCYAQLGFVPYGEAIYAFSNGKYAGRITQNNALHDVWTFDFLTNFDLDSNDNLIVKNFAMFNDEMRDLLLPLKSTFTLTYSVNDYIIDGLEKSSVDSWLGLALLPNEIVGITVEKVSLTLGTALSDFWANRRALGGDVEYQKYTSTLYKFYEADEYAIDPISKERLFTIENGTVVYQKIHSKGDPVIGPDGQQTVMHYKDSLVLDDNQQPIPISQRPVLRLVELFVIDGVYYYANDKSSKDDVAFVPNSIVDTYIPTLQTLSKRKLEKTKIYLYPKKTIGAINVYVDNAVKATIDALLSFEFVILATETGYTDMDFRSGVELNIRSIVNGFLKNQTVSSSGIIGLINRNEDDRIAGIDLKILGNNEEIVAFTTIDDSYRATVRRLSVLASDGTISVEEDIKFDWQLHNPDK